MNSTFSISAKLSIGAGNGSFQTRTSAVITRREDAITAPRRRSNRFPGLTREGIPHTDLHVGEVLERKSGMNSLGMEGTCRSKPQFHPGFLEEGYDGYKKICAEYAKTFYLGTRLMTEERQKAIWAIYDELVDGPNATYISTSVLDRWEERLHDIFNGRPYDMLDAALTDAVFKFPLDIKPFRDMIEWMRMDIHKRRYQNFQELYLYCYCVTSNTGLMSVPVMGIVPESHVPAQSIYNAALYLGIGNRALRGRVYLSQDELALFGLCDKDVFSREDHGCMKLMKEQITRARFYFNLAEDGASQIHKASRWPVWSSLLLYRKILDAIEDNDYDNLTKRAFVGRIEKPVTLPSAYRRAALSPRLIFH
ncbi:hypothetical protein SLEP1_g31716 [Rubroshorea leprosula]|uniref:15-cis-phytoene synthase n=1 Tax=Rubroshorea leprosula TaxID=152421 RepID=A0AAV5KAU6_9ROSI|nr:hypothetical protein SLEP1_g31716 [Rubroshorea leprosula]